MYDAKGRAGKQQILDEHVLLIKKLAHQLKAKLPANIEVDDLIQAGMIGLLDAMQRYQDNQQAQFETYAVQRIRGSMLDELRNMDWLPRSIRQNMRKIENAINSMQQDTSKHPSESQIAEKLDLPLSDYQKLLSDCAGHQLLYFEDFQNQEEDDHFLDRFYTDTSDDPLQELVNNGFHEALAEAISQLPERDNLIMGLYYEQELNLKEIGAILDISESRVSQLHSQAIARIRGILRREAWTGEV
jgi:RNA polymerase sigma factor for flagellar operon FliA